MTDLVRSSALVALFLAAAPAAQEKPASQEPKAIYDTQADGRTQIDAALKLAKRDHKRVLVMFGANWCGWCHRLHGVFGKTELTRQGSGLANDTKPFNPKEITYEIFGPPGAVATINYLDLDAQPQIVRDTTLPWSLTLSTTAPAASANIVAQGDTDTIGCRILVDGVLKDEKTSSGVNAQTFCLVKSA